MSEKSNRLGKSEVQKFTHPKLVIVIAILAITLTPIEFSFATEPTKKISTSSASVQDWQTSLR
jgi:hypothetical protein